MYKIAFFASTRGTNLQSLIEARDAGSMQAEISCLITNKADCGAVEKARAAGIPVHVIDGKGKPREETDKEAMKIMEYYNVDLIVLGGYMRIFSYPFVQKYRNRIINIHPSLLPKYPGMDLDVHKAVIDGGETESGMTIHFVDEGMDTGPIILQKSVPVAPGETPDSLKAKVQELEKNWYPKVVQMFAEGKIN
jgi:phosphoribosylglycinamide formyltransferase-1